jgi:ABC-2 type transport system permease protein
MTASIMLLTDMDLYARNVTQVKLPFDYEEELLGNGNALTDFDLYVPGIVMLAILNVMFTAGASFIKESDKGTMQRLILSRLKTREYIGAISLLQIGFCLLSNLLAVAAAMACGFVFHGSIGALLIIGTLSGIGIVGLSLITVSFLRSVFDLMTVGMVPYFIVMFFAGIFFPLPMLEIARVGKASLALNDLLPLSLSVKTLNQVLNFGGSLPDIGIELAGLAVVSLAYFLIGLSLFRRRRMRLA